MDGLDTELAKVAAVLLEDRVLRRVIKKHRHLPGVGLQVPHARCDTLPRDELVKLVEPDELGVEPSALPAQIVVVGGARAALAAGDPGELSRLWRVIFHGRVHQAFEALIARKAITPASIRARIHRVGQTEFDEIRSVLRQEDLLLPPADDTSAYVEFVALYLELRHFAPSALARTFPTLDRARVDAAVALDLDAGALLAAARPPRAPARPLTGEPAPPSREVVALPLAPDASARRKAARARAKGNRARAAIYAVRAGDRETARSDLDELCARLARALGIPAPAPDWAAALLPLAERAAAQRVRFGPEARLLHDLQTACVVADREIKVVDVAGWAVSLGKRPLVRALPATREIRVAKHLHAAAEKLAGCGLPSGADHDRLAAAVRDIAERGDAAVRAALRPKIEAALDGVKLHPRNLPEYVARSKLIRELLDQAVAVGRLSIGNLRDAISHNDLKVPDLRRHQLRSGDELLRCDRALARSLDGVYRPGEGYLRFLQKASSILFGTPAGRFLSLYFLLPLIGSYTVLEGLQHMMALVTKYTGVANPILEVPARYIGLANPLHAAPIPTHGDAAAVRAWLVKLHDSAAHPVLEIASRTSILAGAVVLFFLLHATPFRRAVGFTFRMLGRGLRFALLDLPLAVLRRPLVVRLLGSPFARWVIRPAIPAAIAFAVTEGPLRWPIAVSVHVLSALALNARIGRHVQEVVADAIVRWGHHLTSRIVPSAIKWTLQIFRELIERLHRGMYRVDEWLRFQSGQSPLTLVLKGTLGTVWGVVAYFLRLYINLFVEPEVNPIKHFPVVTVAAKIILPFSEPIGSAISGPASQLMGHTLGVSFAAFTVIVLPGLAGFLVWELKENWKLYRNTRPSTLQEISIGHHGESMVGFLKPGLHSGTIPKRFTKLRRSAWKADEPAVAKHRAELHHIEDAITKFADRELVSMLNHAGAFRTTDVAVADIVLGSNRVYIELACPSVSAEPARLAFEHQSGWTTASVPERGWIDHLADDQRQILELALAGFYKRAGVELVREQLEAVLGGDGPAPAYDISDEGLIVWPGDGYQTEAVYHLRARFPTAKLRGARWTGTLPPFAGRHALYFREQLTWAAWTHVWEQLARGEPPARILAGPSLLRRPPAPAAATTDQRTSA